MSRQFLAWEINHLKKWGANTSNLREYGDTPVEYITRHAAFKGLDLYVTPDCLIPRIETEKIVDIALDFIVSHKIPIPTIADIGCGSGAIGIAIAHNLEKNHQSYNILLSDISPSALQIAQKNATSILTNIDHISYLQSDLLSNFPPHTKINCLVSNLPYIPSSRIMSLDSSVKDYEPHLALDGGPDGTDLINRLINEASPFLATEFIIVLEIDDSHQLQHFKVPNKLDCRLLKDDFGQTRFLIISPQ